MDKLNRLLAEVWERNLFYTHKWCEAGVSRHQLSCLDELQEYPLITRAEIAADQAIAPPLGTNLTISQKDIKRVHRSSGTTQSPIFWADNAQSWEWVLYCSQRLFLLNGIKQTDRVLFTMSFSASSGPWIIYEGACRMGCSCMTAGSIDPGEQLQWLENFKPTVVVGKPSRLGLLAMEALDKGEPRALRTVKKLILSGESAPSQLKKLERLWSAECFDRYGLTEAGSVASGCLCHCGGMHVLDDEFIAEVVHPETGQPLPDGEYGELVLTNLGRWLRPIVRYRTGDLTRLVRNYSCACRRHGATLFGGIKRSRPLTVGNADCRVPENPDAGLSRTL